MIGTINDNDTGKDIHIYEQDDRNVTFDAGATFDGDGANGQFGGRPCYAPRSYGKPTLDHIVP
jgi:hypothetical protein